MASSADGSRPASDDLFRRDTIRYIVLPMVGLGVLVLVGGGIAVLLPGRLQVALIADWLFTILFLCPLVLCLFPICVLMVVGVVAMNRANQAAAIPLRRLHSLSATVKDQAIKTTDIVNRQTINASVKFAFIDRLLAVFDPPASPPENGNDEE